MKIAISGKGGTGKTTISALVAQEWVSNGKRVLAIDADPVPSLAEALGFPHTEQIVSLNRSELVKERTGAKPGTIGQMFILNPRVDDIPNKIAYEHNGIKLIVMGGIKKGGDGCVCPESALIKTLVRHVIQDRNEEIIMDMEAGIEHLGRGTAEGVDCLLTVVDPSLRSIQTARRIKALAGEIGIKNIRAVGNKINSAEDIDFIQSNLKFMEIISFIPYSSSIVNAERQRDIRVSDPAVQKEIKTIIAWLSVMSPRGN